MECSFETFTPKEEYWIQKLLQGEELLETMDNKSESWLTDSYLNYLDMMIKYGNLRNPEVEYEKVTRLIKVNKVIPKELLKAGNYYYTVFNGVYIVQQVVFAKAEHCEALLSKQLNDNENLKEDELLISSFKNMVFDNGERWCVFLAKSGFTDRYLSYASKEWDYPFIWDGEE